MPRIDEIAERIDAIETELRNNADGIDVNALGDELQRLFAERADIAASAERRSELIETIVNNNNMRMEAVPMPDIIEKVYNVASPEYRTGWLKTLQGVELNAEERSAMTSGTSSAGYAIPTETENKIITNITQIAPVLARINLLHVPANITLPVEGTVNAAGEHTEGAAVTESADTITKISLTSHEIVKLVPISATVATMAVDAFEAWLVEQIGRKIAEEIENRLINGDGGTTVQSLGIESAETWADGTNAVDWAGTAPTAAELIEAISYLPAAYAPGAVVLMNWKTFWGKVFSLRDDKNPAVVTDGNGGYRCFGFPVVLSGKVADDTIYIGDPREGLVANMAHDVDIAAKEDFGHLTMVYRGYCLFDCAPVAGRWVKCAATV